VVPAAEWAGMVEGASCPICADAALETNPHSDLITETPTSWIRLSRNQTQAGYSVVVLKRHAAELCDLTPGELTGFWSDVAAVSRVVLQLFHPVKLDSLVMGHLCPHVHCHIYPQYERDDPHALINIRHGDVRLEPRAQRARVGAMRRLLAEG
jgi:diadenosine tetraphosphate (Ap4A) HIT family hydrolase